MSEAAANEDVITGLRHRYDALTNSQKRIAEMVVDDPHFVAFATVDKFAARLGVSPSTIVRFAYRLGLGGYSDLQDQVRELVLARLRAPDDRERWQLGEGVFGQSIQHDAELLQRTAERLDEADLQRAVDMLVAAERLGVVGGVRALSVAYYAAITLDRVRRRVALRDATPMRAGMLLDMSEGDVLLAFSFPPYARGTLDAIDTAKRRGASVVAVSDSPISPLSSRTDVLLPVAVSGIGAQNSYVAAMSVAGMLVNGVASQAPGALERYSDTIKLLDHWGTYLLDADDPGANA